MLSKISNYAIAPAVQRLCHFNQAEIQIKALEMELLIVWSPEEHMRLW